MSTLHWKVVVFNDDGLDLAFANGEAGEVAQIEFDGIGKAQRAEVCKGLRKMIAALAPRRGGRQPLPAPWAAHVEGYDELHRAVVRAAAALNRANAAVKQSGQMDCAACKASPTGACEHHQAFIDAAAEARETYDEAQRLRGAAEVSGLTAAIEAAVEAGEEGEALDLAAEIADTVKKTNRLLKRGGLPEIGDAAGVKALKKAVEDGDFIKAGGIISGWKPAPETAESIAATGGDPADAPESTPEAVLGEGATEDDFDDFAAAMAATGDPEEAPEAPEAAVEEFDDFAAALEAAAAE